MCIRDSYITEQCALIDAALDRLLPAEDESPETIHKAIASSDRRLIHRSFQSILCDKFSVFFHIFWDFNDRDVFTFVIIVDVSFHLE